MKGSSVWACFFFCPIPSRIDSHYAISPKSLVVFIPHSHLTFLLPLICVRPRRCIESHGMWVGTYFPAGPLSMFCHNPVDRWDATRIESNSSCQI
jgi:hypothetical protein